MAKLIQAILFIMLMGALVPLISLDIRAQEKFLEVSAPDYYHGHFNNE